MLKRTLIVDAHVTELIKTTVDVALLAGNVNVPIRVPVCAPMFSHVGFARDIIDRFGRKRPVDGEHVDFRIISRRHVGRVVEGELHGIGPVFAGDGLS